MPDGMTYEQAASTQTTFATAWHCLITRARVRAGETVLVSAAGSGVSARRASRSPGSAGARVITTRRQRREAARALELGADVVHQLPHRGPDRAGAGGDGGRGVDVVLEHVGGDVFEQPAWRRSPMDGSVVVCGGHAGEVVPLDLIELFRHELSVIGCARATEAELRHVIELVGRGDADAGGLARCWTSARRARGPRLMEDRRQFGKVVLIP